MAKFILGLDIGTNSIGWVLFKENKATSAPEIVKVSSNKTINVTAKKVVPCGLINRKT